MNLLKLFSGTGSVGHIARSLGFKVISLELKNADINDDILKRDYKQFDKGHFDFIWTSPPCTEYSTEGGLYATDEVSGEYSWLSGLLARACVRPQPQNVVIYGVLLHLRFRAGLRAALFGLLFRALARARDPMSAFWVGPG